MHMPNTIGYTGVYIFMMKRLIKHGNSRAIVVDKTLLEAAGISENAIFQISVNPSGGLIIQSVENNYIPKHIEKSAFRLGQSLAV